MKGLTFVHFILFSSYPEDAGTFDNGPLFYSTDRDTDAIINIQQ